MGGAFSPDIVPWGTGLDPVPASLATEPQWDEDLGQPLLPAVSNNVYVRCANSTQDDVPGHLFLAIGAAGLPCWPDQLQAVPAPGGKPYVPLKVSGGQAAAIPSPFACTPGSSADTLAAWLVTARHKPDPSVALDNVVDLKAFFEENAGYAQRSVAFGITDSYTFTARYDQRKATADMQLELRCHDCPVGWTLSVLSGTPTGPLQLEPFVLTNSSQIMSLARSVPAGYDDTLTLRIDTHGLPPQAGARVDLVLSVQLPAPVAPSALAGSHPASSAAGSIAQPTLFRLGCHSWRAQPPPTDAATRGPTRHRSQP
jgi:hypothetical protein